MSTIDIVSNGLTMIQNAQKAHKISVLIPANGMLSSVVKILKDRGYIEDFKAGVVEKKNLLDVKLRYDEYGEPIISKIGRISRSSKRVYSKSKKVPRMANGYATVLVSTSQGVMTGREARDKNVGGEVICYIM